MKTTKKGFTFFELMFALALFGVNFHMIYSQVTRGVMETKAIENRQQLLFFAEQRIEEIMRMKDSSLHTETLKLPDFLSEYECIQNVLVMENGMKNIEILILRRQDEVKIFSVSVLKAEGQW